MTLTVEINAILEALRASAGGATGVQEAALYARALAGYPVVSVELPKVEFSDLEDSTVPIGQRRLTITTDLIVYVQLTNAGDDCAQALSSALAVVDQINNDPSLGATVDDSQVLTIESFINETPKQPTAGYVITTQVIAFIAAP